MKPFKMPSLGADMEGGTLVEWLKVPGDAIHRGDIIAIVETVKGAIEIECFDDGVLTNPVVASGTTVAVGDVLAYLDGAADETNSKAAASLAAPHRRVSPAARKRADELGIDIELVRPGPGEVVGIGEVEAAAATSGRTDRSEPSARPRRDPTAMRDAMRQAIGRAMARSKREIPHYYVSNTIDVTVFHQWFEATNAKRPVAERMLYAAPLIKAIALALQHASSLNGTYEDGAHHPNERVHIGVATAIRGGGLVAPAIHDADQLSPDELMTKLRDLVARVRANRIRSTEMSDPTITLSILGENTADSLQPVIYPPQVAIIGCGAIRERPWVIDETVAIRRVMNVTVAGDHRVSDGRAAARFLNRLDIILQEPQTL